MSPRFVITRMETIAKTYGFQAFTAGRFKQEREAWITAVWSMGQTERTAKEYWIEIETVEQTPDTKVHHLDQSAGHNKVITNNVEIVEWDEHRENVLSVIEQKCGRAYPNYFSLVVLGRNGKEIDLETTVQRVQGLKVPFGAIWILGRTADSTYKMVSIHPDVSEIEFDLARSLQKLPAATDFLIRQKRGKSTQITDLGLTFLPLP